MQPVLAGECVGGAWESYKTFSATNITVHFVTCNQVEVKQGNYLDRKRGRSIRCLPLYRKPSTEANYRFVTCYLKQSTTFTV